MVSRSRSSAMSPRSPKVSKPSRKSRLRLSCHDCFKAKVKCNKARPGCARCLTIGRECGYVEYDKDGNVVGNTGCEPEANGLLYAVRDDNSFDTFPGHGQDWNPALTAAEENMGPAIPGPDVLGGGLGLSGSIGASCYADSNNPPLSMPFSQYPSQLGTNAELDTPNPAHWAVQHQACECVGYCLRELERLQVVSDGGGTDMLDLDDMFALSTSALDECSALLMCETCIQTTGRQALETLAGSTLIRISYLYLDEACRVLQSQNGQERAAQRTRLTQSLARFDGVCGAYAQMLAGSGMGAEAGGVVITPMMEHLGERLKVLRAVCDWRVGAV
ncbi:hypothetical protein NEMBOFW57_004873 [Staphylotrichum longicolle]|uniref:Zn(2)-C6 fungal-type domain-containing protein n=1 Tax=Staphylotrichum longicolle TaxID=669026 RepID=A0AAD4EW92_9PEZI|nr:hypothetical protein NEMBOFW57_004873 [Staphylotrichum longicolle]